jgi:ABC-type transport system substrate-binding protein
MEDDTTLIMKLKDGIYFSNGDKATSEDLLFAYSNHVERGSNYMDNLLINFDECECIDEFTLKMKFEKFYTAFYDNTMVYLLDKSWSEEVGWDSMDWYAPVGSGPYACTEYTQEDHMTFVARDDYWNAENDPIVVKQWTLKYYSDPKTMTLALENGDIAMCAVPDSDYTSYVQNNGAENDTGFVMKPFKAGVVSRLMFSFIDTDVFYDKNVRAAFAYGIKWDELGEIVSGELYTPALSYVSADSPEFVDVGRYEYDLDKAIALLKEDGYDESNPLVLSTYQMDTPWYKDICEAFQFYASQMGVTVNLEFGDISAALTEWFKDTGTDFGFLYNNLGSQGQQLCMSMDSASNPTAVSFAYIDDPKFLELYTEATYAPDKETSIEKSKECQQYMHDEYLSIPIAEFVFVIGYNQNVLTEEMIPYGCMNAEFYNLGNWSHASAWE